MPFTTANSNSFLTPLLCTIAIILCFVLQIIFLRVEKQKKFALSLVFKGAASLCFVILGIFCTTQAKTLQLAGTVGITQYNQKSLFCTLIIAGLIADAVGDVIINLRYVHKKSRILTFLLGTISFYIGHVCYLVALIPFSQNISVCIAMGTAAAVMILWSLFYSLKFIQPLFKFFGIIYITTITYMVSVSFGNLILHPNQMHAVLFAAGAVLFLISDILLILNTFGKKKNYTVRVSNLLLYYTGQLLIALSLFFI